MHVREVTTEDGFNQLQGPWNGLVVRIQGHVFLRHEWFVAAWAWRRHRASLRIICVFSGDELVGVLPLIRAWSTAYGGRSLEYLSVPDVQLCDLLVDPDSGAAVGRLVVQHLLAAASHWDFLCIDHLPAGSAAERWLVPILAGHDIAASFEAVDSNPFVDLSTTWPAYLGCLSRSIKKTRNLAANRLERAGGATVEWVTSTNTSAEHLPRVVDRAIAISARSWKRGTGYSLEAPGPRAFIRSLTESAHAQGWLSLWFLHLDGVAVAMEYQLVDRGVVYALRADFDDQHQALSIGTYLNFHMLERLFTGPPDEPLSRYCMGPGNNPYKLRWSGNADKLYRMTCYSPTMRGRVRALWSDVKPRLRHLRNRLAPRHVDPVAKPPDASA